MFAAFLRTTATTTFTRTKALLLIVRSGTDRYGSLWRTRYPENVNAVCVILGDVYAFFISVHRLFFGYHMHDVDVFGFE